MNYQCNETSRNSGTKRSRQRAQAVNRSKREETKLMPIDPEYLRQYYASLSDEAILAVNRADLVNAAQRYFDDEFRTRELSSVKGVSPLVGTDEVPAPDLAGSKGHSSGDKPEWLEEAAEVYLRVNLPDAAPAGDVLDVSKVFEAAGIPCYLDF
jgi:hypothetical protein